MRGLAALGIGIRSNSPTNSSIRPIRSSLVFAMRPSVSGLRAWTNDAPRPFSRYRHTYVRRKANTGSKLRTARMMSMPLKFSGPILLEDGCVLHRVLVRPRSPVDVSGIGIPGSRRIGMIVRNFAVSDNDMVRKHAAHRFMEAASNRILRHPEVPECLGITAMQLHPSPARRNKAQPPLNKLGNTFGHGHVQSRCSTSESSTRIRSLAAGRLRQVDFYAAARRLDITDIDQSGQCGRPETRDRAAAGIERKIIARALVVPARRHHPRIVALEIPLLWSGVSRLIPGMPLVHWLPRGSVLTKISSFSQSS